MTQQERLTDEQVTAPLTQEQIDEGEALLRCIRHGEWHARAGQVWGPHSDWPSKQVMLLNALSTQGDFDLEQPVVEAVVWLRNNAPAIFATIKALQARVRELSMNQQNLYSDPPLALLGINPHE